jgi:acyl-CoA reductase-like NAD-dependent aldehyde dehydrogenase
MERVLSFTDIAKADGAKLLVGGARDDRFAVGHYMQPTAVLAPSGKSRICQEEVFGPFATFLTFDGFDEAISIANDSRFGLVSYVWSEDMQTVLQASRAIRSGVVWVNTPMVRELRAPFGGFKESGMGREGGHSSMQFYTAEKTTTIPIGAPPMQRIGLG